MNAGPRSSSAVARVVSPAGEARQAYRRNVRPSDRRTSCHVHTVQPAVVSLTQATELGTAYRPDEIAALSKLAHGRGLAVQMDGARFANALAFLGLPSG